MLSLKQGNHMNLNIHAWRWLTLLMTITYLPASADEPTQVMTAPVEQIENFADLVEALGTTRSNETVDISTNVTETVTEIFFDDGQQIKRGDILLTLEKSEEEADLKAAKALLDERTASYKRALSLQKQQALSTATLEERLALLSQTEGAIEAIQSRINDRIIKAPFNGVLGFRNVSPGTLVRPGDLITTIDDLSKIKIDFDIPSVFLADIRPGLKVEGRIEAFGDRVFKGEVSTVNTRIDPVTRTMRVRAELPNPDLLIKPGLLMSITLMKSPRSALLIPEEAILQRKQRFFVYKIDTQADKTIAREVEVIPGSRIPGKIEVRQGLQAGDQVVVHGLMQVKPDKEVVIRAIEKTDTPLAELLKQQPHLSKAD
jgi:membrane fusion protein (multidrug efflux system)